MDSTFPCFDSYVVIEDSSGEEEEEEEEEKKAEEEKQKPSTSKVGLPPDPVVKKAVDCAVVHFFDKNKDLLDHQVKLCDEYMDEGIKQCMADADDLDNFILGLEEQMESLKNDIYGPYQPIVTSLEPVDIDELEDNMEEEQEEVNMPQKEINKPIQEIKVPKEAKKVKLDESNKSDTDDIITIDRTESDKDDIITIDRTVCVVPANLPLEGVLEYPDVEGGQTVYAMKLTIKEPWYSGYIKNIVNQDYVHVIFELGEKLVTTKQIAYYTLNSVRFPVGCRVIAKFTDPNTKCIDEFYAGLIAEPPNMLNNFR